VSDCFAAIVAITGTIALIALSAILGIIITAPP
jgi:hypothetical protein